MAERDWVRPEMPVEAADTAWTRTSGSRFELRPLSLGELLDRTFALYRSRFWLFAGISMIAAAINVVAQGISLAAAHQLAKNMPATTPATPMAALLNIRTISQARAGSYLVMLLFVLVSAVTHAGTALALTDVYLGKSVTVKEAFARVLPRWYRWIGIAIWQGFSFAWIPLLVILPAVLLLAFGARGNVGVAAIGGVLLVLAVFGGFPAGFILFLRNALAVPAAVTEGLTIRPAMRRSKMLAVGTKGRIFVVLLIAGALLELVGILQAPATLLLVMAPNQEHYLARVIALSIAFCGHTVVAPVALIGLTLVYFDQRVRKEALDLQLLLEDANGAGALNAGGAAPSPEGYAPSA